MTPSGAVAFCGLGRMGMPMARRVAEAGMPVRLWNRSPAAAASLSATVHGAVGKTPAEAARGADRAVTMVSDEEALMSVLTGPDGLLVGLRAGALVMDCSTIGPAAAVRAASACVDAGVRFLDAPVSGSTTVADRGELGVMVGGSADDLHDALPVLHAFASTVVHVGPTGAGAAAKVAVNALLHSFNAALAESVVIAERHGVPRAQLFEVLRAGVLHNRFLAYKRDAYMARDGRAVAFDITMAAKDLRLATTAADSAETPAGVIAEVLRVHEAAVGDGLGEQDIVALVDWFGGSAG